METIKELFEYFKNNNISTFKSNKPGVIGINGRFKKVVLSVKEVNENESLSVWESFYNDKWYTFVKNINLSKIAESNVYKKKDDFEDDDYGLTDVFDRDELCDPDILESWDDEARSRYGEDGLEHYKKRGFFWNDRMENDY